MFWQNAYARTINLPQSADTAIEVDVLHDFLVWMSLFFLVLVAYLIVDFVRKYSHKKKGRTTEYILDNHVLEFTWTVVPLILMLFVFAWGYHDYLHLRTQRAAEVEVNVTGRQWAWNFEYTNGRKAMIDLVLPVGKVIRLIMTSEDVLHSFFIPDFRIKQDVVPGMFTSLIFKITEKGPHPVFCAEYCGTSHSGMYGYVIAVEPKDYEKYLRTGKIPADIETQLKIMRNSQGERYGGLAQASGVDKAADSAPMISMIEKGKALVAAKGCVACHSLDGSARVGPSYRGIFGKEEEMKDGQKITVDENYIRESLMEPQAKIVKGFPPSMPTFKGQLTDEEVNALVAYIKSLK